MLREKLAIEGAAYFPYHAFDSHDNIIQGVSSTFDVSTSMSLIEKSFITFVNHGAGKQFTKGSYEIPYEGGPDISGSGARHFPNLKELRMAISGKDYPSADGLNNATLTEYRRYTEQVEGVLTNVPLEDYGAYRFYTVVDYTGHKSLFIVPEISVDVGEKVNARLVQLIWKMETNPATILTHCYVYHYGKKMLKFKNNLALEDIQ